MLSHKLGSHLSQARRKPLRRVFCFLQLVLIGPKMKTALHIAIGLAALALSPTGISADVKAGASVAQSCTMCHGEKGLSSMAGTPSIAGQPEMYLAAQLRDFRDGKRHNEVMSLMAKPLSDADIDNVSAYFAQFEIQLKKP
jgi:cytochrome c553